MSETAEKLLHGFNTAVLTQKSKAKPSKGEALHFSETGHKGGLFLISKDVEEITQLNNKGKRQAARKKTRNRKTVMRKDIFEYRGKSYRVNSAKSGLYVETLKSMINQFELAAKKWSRVFVLRFDLHTHYYTGDSKRLSKFSKRLFMRLRRDYGFKEIGFCWAREMERAKSQHYHFVLFLDGRLVRHSKRINELIKAAWDDGTGAYHVPFIKRPYYFGSGEQITDDVIYRLSYLAKARGKGYRDKQAKDFQCSRMKTDFV